MFNYGALAEILQKVANNDPKAQAELGLMFLLGGIFEKKPIEAFRLFQASADKGNSVGQAWLGEMYYLGVPGVVDKDLSEAFRLFQASADKGHPYGQVRLGEMYYKGATGVVDKDLSEAFRLFQASADKGHPYGQAYLGGMYYLGVPRVVDKDLSEAFRLFQASADKGHPYGQAYLGGMYYFGVPGVVEQNLSEAFRLIKASADQGHPYGQALLGKMYYLGVPRVVEQNLSEAFRLFQASADKGNSVGQAWLGEMYYLGVPGVVDKDLSEAFRLFQASADKGHPYGQVRLGEMYYLGVPGVVDKDLSEAFRLFQASADKGHPYGRAWLAEYYRRAPEVMDSTAVHQPTLINGPKRLKTEDGDEQQSNTEQQTRYITPDILERIARRARGNSSCLDNCVPLTKAILQFLFHGAEPSDPVAEQSASVTDFGVNLNIQTVTIKQESETIQKQKEIVSSTVIQDNFHDCTFWNGRKNGYYQDAAGTLHLDREYVDLTKAPQNRVNQIALDNTLKNFANISPYSCIGGMINLGRIGRDVNMPGHQFAFIATSNQVIYIDPQRINNGDGYPLFYSIGDGGYDFKETFSRTIFFLYKNINATLQNSNEDHLRQLTTG